MRTAQVLPFAHWMATACGTDSACSESLLHAHE
jgi:hypothetical protein